jgi:hypothetical protein
MSIAFCGWIETPASYSKQRWQGVALVEGANLQGACSLFGPTSAITLEPDPRWPPLFPERGLAPRL